MIINSLLIGGTQRRLVEFLKYAVRHDNITFDLVALNYDVQFPALYNLPIKIHCFQRKIRRDPTIFFELYKLFKEIKPDIVHSWSAMTSVYVAPIVKLLGIKFINGMIGNVWTKNTRTTKLLLYYKFSKPFSDIIIGNSKEGLKSYNAVGDNCYCIYNGIDLNRFDNLESKKDIFDRFNIKTNKVVGMVATFRKMKDYQTYLDAAEKVVFSNDDVTFLCVGDGPFFEHYKNRTDSKLREKIIFTGKQKDVESIINVFDIGVLSSFSEGLSNAIIEIMLLGKTVIATNVGGTKEIITHGKTGRLFEVGDVDSLTQNILELLENKTITNDIGTNAKRYAENMFSLDIMVQKYLEIYFKLYMEETNPIVINEERNLLR